MKWWEKLLIRLGIWQPWTGPRCVVCGGPITDYKRRNKKYCSRLCENAARRERGKNENM